MDKFKNTKILTFNNKEKEEKAIELGEKELEVKRKLEEVDRKIDMMEEMTAALMMDNKDTIFSNDVIDNVIGLVAIKSASKIIGEYFGFDNFDLNDIF